MQHKYCTAEAPMPIADKDRYHWSHGDAVYQRRFFNLALYTCPHCQFTFHAIPRQADAARWHQEGESK